MVVLEKPAWMTAVVLPLELTGAEHLPQFDLGRFLDLDGFTVVVDHLHDDIEWPVFNWILKA